MIMFLLYFQIFRMDKAMNLEVGENEELESQQDDRIFSNRLTDMKNHIDMAFENPGLYHISEAIFKNLDFKTKLTCRQVRKSWNAMFEKQASTIIRVKNVLNLSIFFKVNPRWKEVWIEFLKESKTEIPTLVLNSYLQDPFNKMISNIKVKYKVCTLFDLLFTQRLRSIFCAI